MSDEPEHDDDSVESDEILFRNDVILEGSVADGLVLSAEPDPDGEWITIAWHERRSVGHWVGMPGEQLIELSLESAEKLLPALAEFVRKGKNATTSYWTGAIADNPKIAERGHASSELDDHGVIILRTEHQALYVDREDLDDVIAVLKAARAKLRDDRYFHNKCGGVITTHDEPSDVPGLVIPRFTCENCGQLTDAQAGTEIKWPGDGES
jgi:hypothetical protein